MELAKEPCLSEANCPRIDLDSDGRRLTIVGEHLPDAKGVGHGEAAVSVSVELFRQAVTVLVTCGLLPSDRHIYLSTYCIHGNHEACRLTCKTCEQPCVCGCHEEGHADAEQGGEAGVDSPASAAADVPELGQP